jgi:WD40 repeat protein
LILAAISGGSVRVWDLHTGAEVHRFENPRGEFAWVTFSQDGRKVLTGAADGTARVWDVASGREIIRIVNHWDGVAKTFFSPDGSLILTRSLSVTRLWEAKSGREVRAFRDQPTPVEISADNRTVLTVEKDKVRLFSIESGKEEGSLEDKQGHILWATLAPDSHFLLVARHNLVSLFDLRTKRKVVSVGGEGEKVGSAAFSPDGRSLLIGTLSGKVLLWDVQTGKQRPDLAPIRESETPVSGAISSVQAINSVLFSTDGKRALLHGGDVSLWDLSMGREIRRFPSNTVLPTHVVALSQDTAAQLSAVAEDGGAIIWDLVSGREIQRRQVAGEGLRVLSYFNSASRATLGEFKKGALWTSDKDVRLVDMVSGREICRLRDGQGFPSVAFSLSGSRAVVASDWDLTLWDLTTGQKIRRVELDSYATRNETPISAIAVSRDGRWALASVENAPPELWDFSTGRRAHRFSGELKKADLRDEYATPTGSAAFSLDGHVAAIAGWDESVLLWDLNGQKEMRRFGEAGNHVDAVKFSADGHLLLTQGRRYWAIWDVRTGRKIRSIPLSGAAGSVTPDWRWYLQPGENGVELWSVQTGQLAATLVSFGRGGWAVVASDGRFDTNDLDGGIPLHWITSDNPMHALPLEVFMRDYYEPRLLSRILNGEKLPPLRNLAELNREQPAVQIGSIELQPGTSDRVRVAVEVSGAKALPQDLRLFRDGQLVGAIDGRLRLDGTGKTQVTFDNVRLPHTAGRQQVAFSAYAFNQDGVKSATVEAGYGMPVLAPQRGRVHILAIGVNTNANERFNLQYAASDAKLIGSTLKQKLEALGEYSGVDLTELISDGSLDGARREQMKAEIQRLAKVVSPEDLVILAFAGHGYAGANGRFYLFPSDLPRTEVRVTPALLDSAVSSTELADWLRGVDAGRLAIILDACQSAASVEGEGFKPGPMGSRGLGQLAYDKRAQVLVATQANSVAIEYDDLQQGLLTYALVRDGLQKGSADYHPKDGQITLAEWMSYAVERVPALYREIESGAIHAPGESGRGGAVARQAGQTSLFLQRPALFDFSGPMRELVIERLPVP